MNKYMEPIEQHVIQKIEDSVVQSLNCLDSYGDKQPETVLTAIENIIEHAQQIVTNLTGNTTDNSSDNS